MLSWIRARIRDHFGFSKAEINGTLLLLLLTSACLLAPQVLKWHYSKHLDVNHDQDMALLEHKLALLKAQAQKKTSEATHPAKYSHTNSTQAEHKSQAKAHLSQHLFVDINTADEVQLKSIKGIGPVLSVRIVKFRKKLGGFVSQAQYQEIYGLQPEVIERLKKHTYIHKNFQPVKLNINTDELETLATHPYLSHRQAKNIVRYRAQYGPFATVDTLGSLIPFDELTLAKLRPYLTT